MFVLTQIGQMCVVCNTNDDQSVCFFVFLLLPQADTGSGSTSFLWSLPHAGSIADRSSPLSINHTCCKDMHVQMPFTHSNQDSSILTTHSSLTQQAVIRHVNRDPQGGHAFGQESLLCTRTVPIKHHTNIDDHVLPLYLALAESSLSTDSSLKGNKVVSFHAEPAQPSALHHLRFCWHLLLVPRSVSPSFSHDWKHAIRIGEASNPGPGVGSQSLTIGLLNPTTIYQKEDDLVSLNSDVLCLAETAATNMVQGVFAQATKMTPFRTFWSAPVPDKITKVDPTIGQTLRGDNLGTAIMTRLPCRPTRHQFPQSAWDTCRLNSIVISTGALDILVIAAYFQTGKSAEARVVNNQLLHDILMHTIPTDLPFVIAGDFNTDVRQLDAFSYFRQLGCQEMFEYHRAFFGFELPPTCKGATRFDSMIIHPYLLKFVQRIEIGPEHQFADHRHVNVHFEVPTRTTDAFTWFVPKSWTLFPLEPSVFAAQYQRSHHSLPWRPPTSSQGPSDEVTDLLFQWSARIERSVDCCLRQQHRTDPMRHPQGFLPRNYRGRCATPRLIRATCPRAPKKDCTGSYEPPCEVTSLKSRLKVRQTRRLRTLEHLFKKYNLHTLSSDQWPAISQLSQLDLLWQAIRSANGYGHSWVNWLLQFEAVPVVPLTLPTFDQLYCLRQITQYDADLYCQQEARLRRMSHKHGINLDHTFKSSSRFYQRLKSSDAKVLPGFPVQIQAQATLCRLPKGPLRLIVHQPKSFRLYAAAQFGDAQLRILDQQESYVTCQVLQGRVPGHGTLSQTIHAFDLDEMSEPFQTYWSQFWNRDTDVDESTDDPWSDLLQSLRHRIPSTACLPVHWATPQIVAQTIHKLKPYKAVGIDGWRAEELQSLPSAAVEDFAAILAHIWPLGLAPHQLIARVILLAKRSPALSINDGRPITILGYISRLTSKIVADQLLAHWAQTWPSAISGGLPFRGVQDVTFLQQFQIEQAKKRAQPWRGFTLDLIKAFNLLPRRVLYHLLIHHGAPPSAINFWFTNLRRLTRRLQIRGNIGPPMSMTTGVPEGDSLSVCAMLVVSSAFYWTLCSPTVYPYAYADNWSYLTTSQRANIQAFHQVQKLVEDLRMQIDYTKSWAWGATAEARRDWQDFLHLTFEADNQIQILNSTKDLGCMTHYTNHIVLGHLKQKIQNAAQRCRKIRSFHTDMLHKARFIQTAVWPHAFFGAETQVVGEAHFRTLRREAARALVGPHAQVSSYLAVHLFTPQLQDPYLYVLSTALSFLRRLFHTNSALAHDFLTAVVHHDGPAVGPAGALARYLNLLGWSLDLHGRLTLDGYLSVSVRHDSLRHIRSTLRRAWAYHLHRQISHRKGIPPAPFDYDILTRALRQLSMTSLRQIAYNLTGGYQVGAVKAQWSATVAAECPHCGQLDTHHHQQLICPAFLHLRQRHPQAVTYLTNTLDKLWLPLPHSFPDICLLRQLLSFRGQDTTHTVIQQRNQVLMFYTDGSADTPLHPETRRAAWSIIQYQPDSTTQPFVTIKIQHVQGPQSISRAELAAVTWIVQYVVTTHRTEPVIITTDSQYVINIVAQITDNTMAPTWHRLAHADLLQILHRYWDPAQFFLRKVKSHQDISQLPPGRKRTDAIGNSWADHAAVRTRQTDHPLINQLFQRAQVWHKEQYLQTVCILKYLADLNLHHLQLHQQLSQQKALQGTGDSADNAWGLLFRARESFQVSHPWQIFRPVIHPAFLTACVWGNQYADLVMHFCASLRWPSDDYTGHDPTVTDGITWHELAVAFVVNTGLQLPTWVRLENQKRAQPLHWQDPRVLALPANRRSLREQAEAFRTIVLYLQHYASTPLIPTYSKKGSLSLTRVGWGRAYTGGFRYRPEIPKSKEVQRTLLRYALDLHCKPPYHPDGIIPMHHVQPTLQVVDAIPLSFEQRFLYRRYLRQCWNRKGDLDSVPIPSAPN